MSSDSNTMIKLIRTDSANADFRQLVEQLDRYLQLMDGDEHPFFAQYNKLDSIPYAVIAYFQEKAAGCGAIKGYSKDIAEIKRMFVLPEYRGQGIAKEILHELESWAVELNFSHCILETGKKQTEAIRLYQSEGYEVITNYGQYFGVDSSICMRKVIGI